MGKSKMGTQMIIRIDPGLKEKADKLAENSQRIGKRAFGKLHQRAGR